MRKIDGLLNEHKKKVLKRLSLSPALQVLGGPGQELSGAQRSGLVDTLATAVVPGTRGRGSLGKDRAWPGEKLRAGLSGGVWGSL